MNLLSFIAAIAWPIVVLIAILILGPGGVLQKSIGELAQKLMSIKSSVDEFRDLSQNFNKHQREINKSLDWLKDFEIQLSQISTKLNEVRTNTNEIVLGKGEKEISDASGNSAPSAELLIDNAISPQDMYDKIYNKWSELTNIIKNRVGPDLYDGRTISEMAKLLLDGRRKGNPLSIQDAELISSLHSQFKRFVRLGATKEEWLNIDLYENFIRGVDRAIRSLS